MSEIMTECKFCKSKQLDLIKQSKDLIASGMDVFMTALETKKDITELFNAETFGFIFCLDCGKINQKLTEGDVKEFRNKIQPKR